MKIATVRLESISPYSQSKYIEAEPKSGESPADREARTWRERIHADPSGEVYIPAMAIKNALAQAAQYRGEKIKGKGMKTWGSRFAGGVFVIDNVKLGIKASEVEGEWLFLNADGKPGSGTRVKRCMPYIEKWAGDVTFHIVEDEITEDIFRRTLEDAGNVIGIGRFRPANRGFYGRFKVASIDWKDLAPKSVKAVEGIERGKKK